MCQPVEGFLLLDDKVVSYSEFPPRSQGHLLEGAWTARGSVEDEKEAIPLRLRGSFVQSMFHCSKM